MRTYQVRLYRLGDPLVSVRFQLASSAAEATALVAARHPDAEAIGEG